MSSSSRASDEARSEIRALIAAKGHAVDNARGVIALIDQAVEEGALARTPALDQYLMDLRQALEQDEGMKLGGKSAEAARFIMRAIDRALDDA